MQAPLVGYNPENGFELYRCFNYKPLKKYGVHCTAIVVGEIYIYIYIHTRNLFVLCLGASTLQEKAQTPIKTGVRPGLQVYIYHLHWHISPIQNIQS